MLKNRFVILAVVAIATALAVGPGTPAQAQNILQNPDFDVNVLGGWNSMNACPFLRVAQDSDLCAGGGSAQITSVPGGNDQVADLGQCRPVTPGMSTRGRGRMRIGSGTGVTGAVAFDFYTDATCQNNILGAGTFTTHTPLDAVLWTEILTAVIVSPGNAGSVRFFVQGVKTNSATPMSIQLDRTYFGSSTQIFEEDMEVGSTCRWSDTVP